MFDPSQGLKIDRSVFTQDRFKENPKAQMAYNANPFLLKKQLQLIDKRQKTVFSGAFGVGKSINFALLTLLNQTLAFNCWLKNKYPNYRPPASKQRSESVKKLIYLTRGDSLNYKQMIKPFQAQCWEVQAENPHLFSKNQTEQDFENIIIDIRDFYRERGMEVALILDQINVYYSDIRKIFEVTCEVQGKLMVDKSF